MADVAMSMVYVLTTPIPDDGDDATDSDKPKGNNIVGPSVVNIVEHNNSFRYNDNKGKRKHHDNTKADPNKKYKVTCWKCRKLRHLKKDCKSGKAGNKANGSGTNGSVDGFTNSLKGATVHVCKDRCWFSLNEGSILHMKNESTALVHGRSYVDFKFSSRKIVLLINVLHVPNIKKNLVSSSVLNNCDYKQVIESNKFVLYKHGVFIGFGYLSNQMFRLNIVNNNIASAFMSTYKLNDSILWHARLGHVHFKRMQDKSKDGLILAFDMDTEKCERGIECIFVGYVENSKSFRFHVIDPNDLVSINSIIESKDAIFDENRFSSVPRPSLMILNRTKDIGGSLVPEEVTEEVVQQHELKLRKSKRNRTTKDFRPEFQLYLIKGTGDEVSDQHSYCFNIEDDPKTFDEAMKSQDVAFWKKAINDEMDSIMGKNTWVLANLPPYCKPLGYYFDTYASVAHISTIRLLITMSSIHNLIIHHMDVKTTLLNGDLDEEVDLTKEFLSSRFSMKDMQEADVILGIRIKHESNGIVISQSYYIEKVLKKSSYFDYTPVSTPMDTSEKLMPNNGQAISQLDYSRMIGFLMYAMTCTRPDIAFAMGKLSMYTCNPGAQHWQAIQRVLKYLKKTMDYRLTYTGYPLVLEDYTNVSWISNTEDNSSTSGWVFLLGGAAGKETEWLKNFLLEISLWSKPIAPISICCDSAAILEEAYNQMYNRKSRHLGVWHSMIHKLIMNGVISIEFVRDSLAYLKLSLGSSIYRVWKQVDTPYQAMWAAAYWGFLGAEIRRIFLMDTAYWGDQEIDEPQSDIILIRRSTRTRHAPHRMCLYIDDEEYKFGDLNEPANYKAALLDPESDKWLDAINVEMQYMKNNEVWDLVDLPPNGKNVGSKWLFKKKTDMDGIKSYIGKCFAIKDLGEAAYILGIKIYRDRPRRLIEAEYIAALNASKEAVLVRKFISGLGVVPTIEEPIKMYYDNTEA
uniref:Zinc finger, CCHC-type n=1 Tax=Tanacetum cinerariifolium TaxID=118510 RepID=A0A699GMV2_TANCI|nr:zinc finger, CCHC-type [Tanacetum cinerariifolium]